MFSEIYTDNEIEKLRKAAAFDSAKLLRFFARNYPNFRAWPLLHALPKQQIIQGFQPMFDSESWYYLAYNGQSVGSFSDVVKFAGPHTKMAIVEMLRQSIPHYLRAYEIRRASDTFAQAERALLASDPLK